MSERQVKKIRKENPIEVKTKTKKRTKFDIFSSLIIVVLVIAVLGLGSWAIYSKYASQQTGVVDDSNVVTNDNQTTQVPTIAEAAAEAGMTTEEYLAEYGLDSRDDITGDTELTMAIEYMTLANYAKLSGMDVAEFREMNGIDDSFSDDTTMGEISAAMMESSNQQTTEETTGTEETDTTASDSETETAENNETTETE